MKLTITPVLLMIGLLLSGLGTINIQHHMIIPDYFANKEVIEVHQSTWDRLFNNPITTDIRLNNEFKSTDSIKDIIRVLQNAKDGDLIVFHISGFGGEVETVEYLINNIRSTKAHTRMIVESPSYSGHSYVAVSGDELIMLPYTYLMFHTSSAYGTDCSTAEGTDRTVSNIEHCQALMTAHLTLVTEFLNSIDILTSDEKQALETGHDVYVMSNTLKGRQTRSIVERLKDFLFN